MSRLFPKKIIFGKSGNLTLSDISKRYRIPVRKTTYLIRRHLIEPIVDGEKLLVPEEEIRRYIGLPEKVRKTHHASYLKTLGPGIITGAADDDPSGIGTYSQAGAKYGLGLTWLAVYLLPMMSAVQETVARIGIVTGKGLTGAISERYGKRILYPLVFLLIFANTVNIGADIGAMVASFQLLVPINFTVGAILLTLFMLFLEITFSYHRYSKVLKWLTISLFAYIVTGFIIQPNWLEVAKSMVAPNIQLNTAFLAAMVAVMGTTISPYLFFWQASEEVEEEKDKAKEPGHQVHHKLALRREIKEMRKDTYVGMSYANVVFLFIVITTAFVLNKNGITNIESASQAAMALKPLAGNFAYLLFTVGIFGVGLLAVPVLAGSSAYGISELFKWHEGLSKKFSQARGFYGVIIVSMLVGLLMNFVGINPIKALYWAAIVNGVISPILMFFIFRLGTDKKVMGDDVNPRWVNIWGVIGTLLMGISAISLFILLALGL
jgi:NRAMP (natural resistance-associated macrophage protein)-like metal ion transporter